MPRNPPRNAFYYFMLDFKERHGKRYQNMKEVADAAGPHWKKLSKDQRKPYEEKALMAKNSMRGGKLTSDGREVEELERQERLEQIKIQDMKDDISMSLRMAADNERLQDELFFIIHINTYCYCLSLDRYYPGEIAITCFSLADGVLPQNVFHRIIKPGQVPLGYGSEAKLQSEQTHQLPVPTTADDPNIDEVFAEMKLFLSTKISGSKKYPPLYADEKMMKMIQSILDTWSYDFGESRPLFKVYNLQYMFRVLRNTVANETVWFSDTYSSREIEKDVYAFTPGICCELHSITDVYVYCSRSITVRYAYTICDNCCGDLGIVLFPGAHIPDQSLTPLSSTRSNSALSLISASSKPCKSKLSIRDEDSDSVISISSKSEWDNRSLVSDSSNLWRDSVFPNLGKKSASSNSEPRFSSANSRSEGQSSARSYAGAIGGSKPSWKSADLAHKEFDDALSTDTVTDFDVGRGRGSRSFNNDIKDFPALGGGRSKFFGRGKRMN